MLPLKIAGTAVKAGLSKNGIKYTTDNLEETATELADKAILKDHHNTVDNTIGRTNLLDEKGSYYEADSVKFTGKIMDESTAEKIKDGRIKEVSIGALADRLVKENEDDDFVVAEGIHYMELSLTPTPGVDGAVIASVGETADISIGEGIDWRNINKAEDLAELEKTVKETKEGSEKESDSYSIEETTENTNVEEIQKTEKEDISMDEKILNEKDATIEKLKGQVRELTEKDKDLSEKFKEDLIGRVVDAREKANLEIDKKHLRSLDEVALLFLLKDAKHISEQEEAEAEEEPKEEEKPAEETPEEKKEEPAKEKAEEEKKEEEKEEEKKEEGKPAEPEGEVPEEKPAEEESTVEGMEFTTIKENGGIRFGYVPKGGRY